MCLSVRFVRLLAPRGAPTGGYDTVLCKGKLAFYSGDLVELAPVLVSAFFP